MKVFFVKLGVVLLWSLLLATLLTACLGKYDPKRPLYQIKNLLPREVPHPPRAVSPIDLTKERMAIDAYYKISRGVGIVVICLALGLFFANPVTNFLGNYGVAGGGIWALLGVVKLFVASYLTWIMWAVGLSVLVYLLYRLRERSISRCVVWVKETIGGIRGNKNKSD